MGRCGLTKERRAGGDRRVADRRQGVLPAPHERLSIRHVAAASILILTVFGIDVVVSLGVSVCFLYVVPLTFLAMYSTPRQSSPIIAIAVVSALLTVLGFFLSAPGPIGFDVANRFFAVTVIGITAMFSLLRKRAEEDVKVLQGLLPICAYCKKIRDDSGYWQQIERYIAARSKADFSHGMCPDCGPKHFPGLYPEVSTKASACYQKGLFSQPEG
ncbi:hypothetical protein [Nitrospira sp. Nam74]